MADLYTRIYEVVRGIPHGKVSTYGQVALLARLPRQARLVGYALHRLPEDSDVPWHRVVNASGRVSLDFDSGAGQLQQALLEGEGVVFDKNDTIDLRRYLVDSPERSSVDMDHERDG
ncbi:MGMT family protein [Candidatus Neomarinimicrobiota bacterium]